MIDERVIYLVFVIDLLAGLSYAIETFRGRVKPNRMTFLIWSLAPMVAFLSMIKQGVGTPAMTTLAASLSPFVVFVATFVNKKAYWKLGTVDFVCGALSILGLILWQVTKVGNLAIVFSLLADGFASFPTVLKAYTNPETENGPLYLVTTFSGTISILALKSYSFEALAFPVYMITVTFLIFVFATFRKKAS